MKKLLLLALAAIFGMSVNAQEPLSERPEGTVKVYDRVGQGIFLQMSDDGYSLDMASLDLKEASDFEVVFAADNKTVYVKNPIAALPYTFIDITDRWVKGTIEGNKITIPHKTMIFSIINDANDKIEIFMGYYSINQNNQAEKLATPLDITYTIEGDKITLDSPGTDKTYLLSCIGEDETWERMSEYAGTVYTLKNADPTGIGNIAKENNAKAVSNIYYDITGRKVSPTAKGVIIKQIKFNDGTQKTVKSINR